MTWLWRSTVMLIGLPASCSERVLALLAGRVDPDPLAEVLEAVGAGPSPPRVLDAAHRRVDFVVDRGRVDVDDPVLDLLRELEAPVDVAGEDRGGETVGDPVRRSRRLLVAVDRLDDAERAEGLLVGGDGVVGDVDEDRRLVDLALVRAAGQDPGAFFYRVLDPPVDHF